MSKRIIVFFVLLLIFVIVKPALTGREASLFERARVPHVTVKCKLGWLNMLFNDRWPKPVAHFEIVNKEPEGGKTISEGSVIIEIARRDSDGMDSSDSGYQLLLFEPIHNLSPGKKQIIRTPISADKFAPGAYWLRPTLQVYDANWPSTLVAGFEEARRKDVEVRGFLRAWIKINLVGTSGHSWREERVLGMLRDSTNYPSLIRWENFWSISGLSLIAIYVFIVTLCSKIGDWIKNRSQVARPAEFLEHAK